MRPAILLAAAAALAAAATPAQDRLVPVQIPYDATSEAYEADLRRVFDEAFGAGVRLRAIVRPSFQLEYAVGLRQEGDRYEIFSLTPARQIWTYQIISLLRSGAIRMTIIESEDMSGEAGDDASDEIARMEAELPDDPADLPLSRCAVPVDGEVAAALLGAWQPMLEQVRTGGGLVVGADGIEYQFSMEIGGRALSGETWSPRQRTRPWRLARLAEAMRDYCAQRQTERLRELTELARGLARRR